MSRSLLKRRANEPSKEIQIWFDEKTLFQDNIREVMEKFDSIDPEIWGKIVYMEKNRRLAKAYARSSNETDKESIIRITNSEIAFDGLTIGLSGFVNPHRDQIILQALSHLHQGVDIIMEESGNIIVHNQTESRIFLKGYNLIKPENKRSDGLGTIKLLPHQRETLFDINCYLDSIESKIGTTINLSKSIDINNNSLNCQIDLNNKNNGKVNCDDDNYVYSIRQSLELETISLICLGRESYDLIETPCYLIIINMVALDILKAKIPQKYQRKLNQSSTNQLLRRRSLASDGQSIGQSIGHRLRPLLNLQSLIRSSSPTISKSSSKDNLSLSSSTTNSSSSNDCLSINLLQPPNQQQQINFNYNNQSNIKVNHHHDNNNYQSSSLRSLHLSSNDHHHQHNPYHNQSNQSLTINRLNKFTLTNQLQTIDRSRSWSILTTETNVNHNQNDQLPLIRLPEPDYDDNNNNNIILTKSTNHSNNQFNYHSLGRSSHVNSLVNQSNTKYNQYYSSSNINSRSKSFQDLSSETNTITNQANYWKEEIISSSSRSKNQSKLSTKLIDKFKVWKS